MADNNQDFTKKILVDVELKSNSLKQELPGIISEINRLTEAQKALTKNGQTASKEYVQNAQDLRGYKSELRDANKYIDNTSKAITAETGTLQQQRAVLSLITDGYTKFGEKAGVTAAQISSFTIKLKDQEKGIEQTYRNVGNYTDALNKAIEASQKAGHGTQAFTAGMGEARKVVGGFLPLIGGVTSQFGQVGEVGKAAWGTLQTTISQFNVVIKDAEKLQNDATIGFKFAAKAEAELATATEAVTAAVAAQAAGEATLEDVQAAVTVQTAAQTTATAALETATIAQTAATNASSVAMDLFKVALAGTGVGLLIVALGSLILYFNSTNEGAKKLQVVFAEVGAVVEYLIKALAPLGKAIYDTFANSEGPVRLLGALLNSVVLPLATLVKLIGDIKNGEFKQAFIDAGAAIKQFGSNVKNTVQGAAETVISLSKNVGSAAGNIKLSTEEIKKAAQAAGALKVEEQKLTKEERLWSEEKLKQQGVLDLLKLKIRDVSTSEKDRIKVAKQAKAISDEIYITDVKHANENLRIVEGQQKLKSKVDYQAITDAKNRVTQLKNSHDLEIQSIQNRQAKVEKMARREATAAEKQHEKEAAALVQAEQIRKESAARILQNIFDDYGDQVVAAQTHYDQEQAKLKKFLAKKEITQAEYNSVNAQLTKEHEANLAKIISDFRKQDEQAYIQASNELVNLKISNISNETNRAVAALKQQGVEKSQELSKQNAGLIENVNQLDKEIALLDGAAKTEAEERRNAALILIEINEAKRIAIEKKTAKDIADINRKAARDKQAEADELAVNKAKKGTNLFNNAGAQSAEAKVITDKYDWEISEAQRAGKSTLLIEQQKQQALKDLNNKYRDERIEYAVQAEQMVQSAAFDIISQSMQQQSAAKIAQLEGTKNAELSNTSLTATEKKLIEARYKKLEDAEKLKAFKANQKLQAANILINGAVGVSKTIAEMGFLPAIPFVALTVASTALQIAKVLSAKPGFATGGQFKSDGRGALLPGYSRSDNTNAYLRSGEAVVVSEAMRAPWARNLISDVNVAFGGRSFSTPGHRGSAKPGFATGGLFTDGGNANRYYSSPVYDSQGLANSLAYQLINNFPNVVVDVKDIIAQTSVKAQTIDRVNL